MTQQEDRVKLINDFKELEMSIINMLNQYSLKSAPLVDKRWMDIAKTQIQQRFMAAVCAMDKPNGE